MKLSKLLMLLNLLALASIVVLSGCGDDDDAEPQIALTADAGADQTVNVGDNITLDGSGSSSSDGSSFDLDWMINNAPTGSSATLSGATTASPALMPDMPGEYTITLTISNEGTESSDDVVITAEPAIEAQEIGGIIDTNTTLTNIIDNPAFPDYIASSSIDLRAVLTIDPGVVIYFAEDVVLDVESGSGTLIAEGSASDSIVFTTANIEGGLLWKGIYVGSGSAQNLLEYVVVSYAGNSPHNFSGSDYPAAIGVESSGKISINHSSVRRNSGYGLYIEESSGQLENFADNNFEDNGQGVGLPADEVDALDGNTTFAGNANADVEIFGSTYSATKSSTWPTLNGSTAYRVTGNIDVDGELIIASGAIFEFDEDRDISVYGSLAANGTDSDNIIFTSSNIAGELHWKGIYINSSSSLNTLSYVDVSYAGNSEWNFSGDDYKAAVGIESSGKVNLTNSSISTSDGYGLYIEESAGQLEAFADNSFSGNTVGVGLPANEVDALDGNTTFTDNGTDVEIFGTDLANDKTVTWNKLNGDATYLLSGDMDINGVLTLSPGFHMMIDENVLITVDGALISEGTGTDQITLTSSNSTGGIHWKGLYFTSSTSNNSLDYTTVSYAGNSAINFSGSDYKANVGVNSGAQVNITNSTITNSGGYGIYSKGNTNNYEDAGANNTFSNNPDGNVSE